MGNMKMFDGKEWVDIMSVRKGTIIGGDEHISIIPVATYTEKDRTGTIINGTFYPKMETTTVEPTKTVEVTMDSASIAEIRNELRYLNNKMEALCNRLDLIIMYIRDKPY